MANRLATRLILKRRNAESMVTLQQQLIAKKSISRVEKTVEECNPNPNLGFAPGFLCFQSVTGEKEP